MYQYFLDCLYYETSVKKDCLNYAQSEEMLIDETITFGNCAFTFELHVGPEVITFATVVIEACS